MRPPHSKLARMLQITTLLLPLAAASWLAWFVGHAPLLGAAGFVLILLGHSVFLGVEFVTLRIVNRRDPAPLATMRQLARAWRAETLQALRVFCWRQPYRWRSIPDRTEPDPEVRGRRGVVFVHGFLCNRGFWTPWLKQVAADRRAFAAVNLEPVFGSIDDYVPAIEEAVSAVARASGLPPVVVCHSMGGVAARAWLRAGADPARVYHIVTIGTPHHGTWLGRFSRQQNGRQMALGSDWLRRLSADCAKQPQPPFTCWYSNCDNVVFPPSTATLPAADNRLLAGAAHVDLAFRPEVIQAALALL